MKTNLIKLMERRVDGDEYVLKSCLVNPEHIIAVQSGKLAKTGPHIIGSERDRELRMIVLCERNSVFVDETVEEIAAMINAAAAS